MLKEKNSQPRSSKPAAQHELRLLLLLLTKKYCSSFVWNSQGAVFYVTEVRDCDMLIVVTSFTFQKEKTC